MMRRLSVLKADLAVLAAAAAAAAATVSFSMHGADGNNADGGGGGYIGGGGGGGLGALNGSTDIVDDGLRVPTVISAATAAATSAAAWAMAAALCGRSDHSDPIEILGGLRLLGMNTSSPPCIPKEVFQELLSESRVSYR